MAILEYVDRPGEVRPANPVGAARKQHVAMEFLETRRSRRKHLAEVQRMLGATCMTLKASLSRNPVFFFFFSQGHWTTLLETLVLHGSAFLGLSYQKNRCNTFGQSHQSRMLESKRSPPLDAAVLERLRFECTKYEDLEPWTPKRLEE